MDPEDGRLPPLTPGAIRQVGSVERHVPGPLPVRYRIGGLSADGPEERGLAARCLVGYNVGPPLLPGGYSNNLQIFQAEDHVVILTEMVHDARIVPLDGRPHAPEAVRLWNGDARGHWDGDTLVVESTNFSAKRASFEPGATVAFGTGATLRLIERFTRLDADTLLRVHRRRPCDLHGAVHRRHPHDPQPGPDLRVRVSRGELRHGQHAAGRPGRRRGSGCGESAMTVEGRCAGWSDGRGGSAALRRLPPVGATGQPLGDA